MALVEKFGPNCQLNVRFSYFFPFSLILSRVPLHAVILSLSGQNIAIQRVMDTEDNKG